LIVSSATCKAQIPLRRLCDFHWNFPAGKVADTSHVVDFHDLCCGLSWFASKVRGLCRRFSPCIVTDQIPLERRKRVCRRLVTDFVANIPTCRDCFCPRLSWFTSATFTETSWFHDLSPFVSATFMICVHNFPRGEVSVKVGVMEFGLNQVVL